jgi:hypothetical protein
VILLHGKFSGFNNIAKIRIWQKVTRKSLKYLFKSQQKTTLGVGKAWFFGVFKP